MTGGNPQRGPRQCALHYGITATGSYYNFDSLRGAPLARNDMRDTAAPTGVYEGSWGNGLDLIRHGCAVPPSPPRGRLGGSGLPRQCALHYGITATGSYYNFDSLRGAPLARNDMRDTAAPTGVYEGSWGNGLDLIRHGCAVPPSPPRGRLGGSGLPRQCEHWLARTAFLGRISY